MSLTITHNFVSPLADAHTPGQVGPDEWNDIHIITGQLAAAELSNGTTGTGRIVLQDNAVINPTTVTIPWQGAGGRYASLDSFGALFPLLMIGANAFSADVTRLFTAGSGMSFDNAAGSPLATLTESGKFGLGLLGAALAPPGSHTPSLLQIIDGSSAAPVTAGNTPTIQISRFESIVSNPIYGDGSDGAALKVNLETDNSLQANAIKATVITNPNPVPAGTNSWDNVALYGAATMNGNNPAGNTAYGAFVSVDALSFPNCAIGYGNAVFNNTGHDYSWGFGGVYSGFDDVANGPGLAASGINFRAGAGGQFDVGLGAMAGSIKTAFLQDDSSSVTVMKVTGGHTNGVDMSGGTFTGAPLLAPLITPSVSSAAGTTGAVTWDSSFVYICTATDHWRRAQLSSF